MFQQKILNIVSLRLLLQCGNQLKCHCCTTQIPAGRVISLECGIEQCIGRRQLLRQGVMICYNNLYPGFLCTRDLCHSGNTIINGDNKLNAGGYDHFYRLHGKPVSLAKAFRNVIAYICPFAFKVFIQHYCSGDPIAIIVAEYKYLFPLIYCTTHDRNRLLHVMHQHRIAQGLRCVQKISGCGAILDAA